MDDVLLSSSSPAASLTINLLQGQPFSSITSSRDSSRLLGEIFLCISETYRIRQDDRPNEQLIPMTITRCRMASSRLFSIVHYRLAIAMVAAQRMTQDSRINNTYG